MTNAGPGERRSKESAAALSPSCRLCWRTIRLARQQIDVTPNHVYVRCPSCGGSFPIRHSDFEAFVRLEEPA
jgi:DNA-directed RNA polymerase subunit RPC12/RpoP